MAVRAISLALRGAVERQIWPVGTESSQVWRSLPVVDIFVTEGIDTLSGEELFHSLLSPAFYLSDFAHKTNYSTVFLALTENRYDAISIIKSRNTWKLQDMFCRGLILHPKRRAASILRSPFL